MQNVKAPYVTEVQHIFVYKGFQEIMLIGDHYYLVDLLIYCQVKILFILELITHISFISLSSVCHNCMMDDGPIAFYIT